MQFFRPFMMLHLLVLAACMAAPAIQQTSSSYKSIDSAHARLLGQEYRNLTALMKVNRETALANRLLSKADDADQGRWVYPEAPGQDEKLDRAHDNLTSALMLLMNAENAEWLAKAQANYDCWAGGSTDEGCRRNFETAMQSLSIPDQAIKTESVFFADDSSVLSPEAHSRLEAVANQVRMNKSLVIELQGHSGGDQNQSLALRRSIALRNVLAQMGVDPSRISVEGEAQSDTILGRQQAETGTDPKTHRVDIMLRPVFGQEI